MNDNAIRDASVCKLVSRICVLMSYEKDKKVIEEYDKIIMELYKRDFLYNNKAKYRRIRKR